MTTTIHCNICGRTIYDFGTTLSFEYTLTKNSIIKIYQKAVIHFTDKHTHMELAGEMTKMLILNLENNYGDK